MQLSGVSSADYLEGIKVATKKLRATNSVVRAVIRSSYWGQNGEFWENELKRNSAIQSAFIRSGMVDETSDVRELRNARFALWNGGTFRAAALSQIRRDELFMPQPSEEC